MIKIEGEGDIVFSADPVGLGMTLSCVQGHSRANYVKLLPNRVCVQEVYRVPTSSGNPGKSGKSLKKSSMHGKIMEFEKN